MRKYTAEKPRCKARAKSRAREAKCPPLPHRCERCRCRNESIAGKDVCRTHGGLTPIKHGGYSKYVTGTLRELIDDRRADPKLLDMREHVATLSALQAWRLGKVADLENAKPEDVDAAARAGVEVVHVIDRYERTQNRPGDFVPKVVIGHVIDAFADAVNLNVSDPAERARMIEAIERILDIKVMSAR